MTNSVDDYPQHEYGCDGDSSAADSALIESSGVASELLQEKSREKSFEDMRSSPRKKYQCRQRIGPMHGGLMPTMDEFFNVDCNDLSMGGISFYLKRPPGCEQFAVVLGQKPNVTILTAKVVSSRPVKHNNQQMYLVGCQFIDRMPA